MRDKLEEIVASLNYLQKRLDIVITTKESTDEEYIAVRAISVRILNCAIDLDRVCGFIKRFD